MVEAAAAALKMDVLEVRRKNFIPKFSGAYQTHVAVSYDSGDYAGALDKLMQMLDYKKFRAEQEAARKQGRLLGIGFSTYIEACSIAPSKLVGALGAGAGLYESAKVRVHPTGGVTVYTGSHSHGQGHETTFSQLVADELGIPMEQVEIVHGDTGQIPFGMGTYGSRSGSVGGTAIYMSLNKIKEKGKKIAAHLLEPRRVTSSTSTASSRSRARRARPCRSGRRADRLRAAQLSGGLEPGSRRRRSTIRRTSVSSAPTPAWSRSTGTPAGHDRALRGGGRRRQHHEPDDRGRHGARWRRPGHRAGALRGRDVRRQLGPADDGHDDGLRDAQGRHAAMYETDRDHPRRSIRSASRAQETGTIAAAPPSSTPSSTRCPSSGSTIEAMPMSSNGLEDHAGAKSAK